MPRRHVRKLLDVTAALTILVAVQEFVRVVLLWSALALAAVAALDWLVRTRRVSPFGGVARFCRRFVDPLLGPVEHRVVRAGGLPASAPWWALGGVVVGGILLLGLLDFLTDMVGSLSRGIAGGASGLVAVLVSWGFGVLQIAILVRVVVSWLPVSPVSPWVRWAFTLSEPILRQLRRFIPLIGAIDVTPIVAFFLLGIVQRLVLSILP